MTKFNNLDHRKHKKIDNNPELKMSSVRIHETILERFNHEKIRSKISFQSVVNRCLDLYINDTAFRNTINSYTTLLVSGSL